jgi:putative endonuclease
VASVRTTAQAAGDDAESVVAAGLAAKGWTILARNVRVGRGELDIVAIDPGPPAELVIVEVRWRRSRAFGLAEETLDHRKRAHLRVAIGRLLEAGLGDGTVLPRLPIRVDLVVLEPGRRDGRAVRSRHHRAIPL